MPRSTRFLSGLVAFAAIARLAFAGATCQHDPINYIPYCQETTGITYNNIGFAGDYNDVVDMDPTACTCKLVPKSFSGPMAPLNEELSLHFRGPIKLKKFAAYTPKTSGKKRSTEEHIRRHAYHHKRGGDVNIVTSTTTITITVPPTTAAGTAASVASTVTPSASVYVDSSDADGDWSRISFYDAEKVIADGLVFLNHMGGQGSGTFDSCFGNSISYANATANGGSAEPTVLEDILVPSNNEFIIMTDKKCEGNDCGYYLPRIPAYHGFDGQDKVFLFEFQMPEDKDCPEFNRNIPAIWALNAKIPRTAQYGKVAGGDGATSCSCWDSGCGELDLFETLVDADGFLKTHYHSKQGTTKGYGGGGAADYFARPYTSPIQAAVVFKGKQVFITILDKTSDFPKALDNHFISSCEKNTSSFDVPS